MRKLTSIYILILSTVFFSFTQEKNTGAWEIASKEEVMTVSQKYSEWFLKNLNYKVDINYASYSDHNSATAHDEFSGFYKRNNNNFHTLAMGVNTIQNEKMKLSIDTISRFIVLNNKIAIDQSPVNTKDFSTLLDNAKSIKKQKTNTGEIIYRSDFKPNAVYSAYEFKINSKGLLVLMKYYYSKELKDETPSGSIVKGKPRLEVSFNNYQTNVSFNYEKDFSEKKYLREEGKKIVLNNKYKNFELKDYRFSEKK
ncbi:MAG: hypothetical protein K0S26_29 [Bacteroidota bacterium]|nr:hypothetical protein [Bacteroidota bacterium]